MGCAHCHKGFLGRTGIFQVMPVSPAMQQLILQEAGQQTLAELAQREGVGTLRQAGLQKVLQGITSMNEVLANTHIHGHGHSHSPGLAPSQTQRQSQPHFGT
jgi:type IV pilus assembly protein PilB